MRVAHINKIKGEEVVSIVSAAWHSKGERVDLKETCDNQEDALDLQQHMTRKIIMLATQRVQMFGLK